MNANKRECRLLSFGRAAEGRGGLTTFWIPFAAGALACTVLLIGCDRARGVSETTDPHIRKGTEQARLKRWDSAIHQFQTALDLHPEFTRPNLELALIHHQHKKEYVRAIYHYKRYIEKRPESEKVPLIKDWIRQAQISFMAQIGQSSRGINEEILRLTRENNLLRKQLDALRPTTAEPEPETEKISAPEPAPAPEEGNADDPQNEHPAASTQTPTSLPETYTVRPGDTLSKIARSVYSDLGRWKDIYNANTNKMKNENDLHPGQILNVPKLKDE